MKKIIFLIFFPSIALANGPIFQHKNTFVQQEFDNVYQDLKKAGTSSSVSASTYTLVVYSNGIVISSPTTALNFTGSGVTVTLNGSTTAQISIPGAAGGGSSNLEVFNNFNGSRSSPTASIGMSNAFLGSVNGSTFTFALNFSSVASKTDLNKFFFSTGVYVSSINVTNALTITGNGTSGSTPQIGINFSSAVSQNDLSLYMTQSSSTANDLKLSSASATYLNKLSPYISSANVTSALTITANGTANSTPQWGVNFSSVVSQSDITKFFFSSGVYVSSINGNAAITVSGNGTSGSIVNLTLNSSSVTLYGPNIPAVSISAGALGSSVLVSSLTSVVGAGSCTNCNATFNAQGQVTTFSNGSSGGGGFGQVNPGTIGQNAYYAVNGGTVTGSSNMITNTSSQTFNVTTFHLFGEKTSTLTISNLSAGVLQTAAVSSNVVVAAVNLGTQVTGNLLQPTIQANTNGATNGMLINIDPSVPALAQANGLTLFYVIAGAQTDANFPNSYVEIDRELVGGTPRYSMAYGMRSKPGEDQYFAIAPIDSGGVDINLLPDVFHVDVSSFSSSKGFVGINVATPTHTLDVSSDVVMGINTVAQRVGGNIFTMTTSSTSANSTAEINLVATGSGTVTIPTGFWQVGKSLKIKGAGFYSSTTTTPGNFTLKLKFGSTVVLTTATVSYVVSQSTQVFGFSTTLTCRATGSSGSLMGQTAFAVYDITNGMRMLPAINTVPVTLDMTANQDVSFTWKDSVADLLNTKTLTNFTVDSQ